MGIRLHSDEPAASAPTADHVRVCDSRVDVRAAVRSATWSLRRAACEADVAEVVQTELIRAWMSGRGLPEDVDVAVRALVWRARREILTRRWLTRQLRVVQLREAHDVADRDAPEWDSVKRAERACDAHVVVDLASRC